MEINVMNYLSEEEIKEICISEIRNKVRNSFNEKDLGRIISNSAYHKVYGMIDDLLPEGYEKTIVSNVEEIMKDIKSYQVFRKKSYYDEASPAQQILEKTVVNMSDVIEAKVKETVEKAINGEQYEDFMEKVTNAMWSQNKITFNFNNNLMGE